MEENIEVEQESEKVEPRTIKCELRSFEKAQTQMSALLKLISIILIVVGALGLVAYIVIGTVSEEEPIYANILLLVGAVLLVIGILYLFIVRGRLKFARDLEAQGTVNEYTFYSDCVLASGSKNGDKLGVTKINYSAVVKVKESADYIFIYYPSRFNAYGIEKKSLTNEQFDTIMKLLLRPSRFGEAVLELDPLGRWD